VIEVLDKEEKIRRKKWQSAPKRLETAAQ